MWDLWWTKWRWGRFSSSTSVSPANLHSTNFSTIIIIRGWYNRPVVVAVPKVPPHKLQKNNYIVNSMTDCTAVMLNNISVSVVIRLWDLFKKPRNKMYSWIVNTVYIQSKTNGFLVKNESLLHGHLRNWFHIGIRSRIYSSEKECQCLVKFGERKVNSLHLTQPLHNSQCHDFEPSPGSLLSRCLLLTCCHNRLLIKTRRQCHTQFHKTFSHLTYNSFSFYTWRLQAEAIFRRQLLRKSHIHPSIQPSIYLYIYLWLYSPFC
jgi:hypothetical protein